MLSLFVDFPCHPTNNSNNKYIMASFDFLAFLLVCT